MTRDRVNDTEPIPPAVDPPEPGSPPLDETDPGDPPEPTREDSARPLTTEAEMLKAEQLIEAFKRPPRRPTPAYAERPQSEGGNAVGYATTARAAQVIRPVQESERVLVHLAEIARRAPRPVRSDFGGLAGAPVPTEVPTGPSEEKRRRLRRAYLGIGAIVAVSALSVWLLLVVRAWVQGSISEVRVSATPLVPSAIAPAPPPAARPFPAVTLTPEPPATETPPSPMVAPEATSAKARPTGPTGSSPEPQRSVGGPHDGRERHVEVPPVPSASPSTTSPLKDQFWE